MIPFLELAKKIEDDIVTGKHRDNLPKINELCQLYNMGPSTVKRALNRLKEQEFIRGFQGKCITVNPAALNNPYFRKNIIVYIKMDAMGNPFYLRVLKYLSSHFIEINCRMSLINSIKQLQDVQTEIDAVIVVESQDGKEQQKLIDICGKEKIIMLNPDCYDYNFIGSDNFLAGSMAMEYLHGELKHRKIGIIGFEIDRSFDLLRINGAMEYAKTHPDLNIQICELATPKTVKESVAQLLTEHQDITAIFLLRDFYALGVYSYCDENRRKIPRDISVLGFDNQNFSDMLSPALSTFQERTESISMNLFETILRILKKENSISIADSIKPVLLERASTAIRNL